ncbi:MAG: GGDEF domain-containing protein [Eggerthellaceae bacterium]|nr:GGDEF domain-containing protein [Eggerthellaceae bacterium]
MKQFQFDYSNREDMVAKLQELKPEAPDSSKVLVHIYCDCWADDDVKAAHGAAREVFPECVVTGSASYGNVVDGKAEFENVIIVINVFEDPSSRIEGLYYPLQSGEAADVARRVVQEVEDRPWVTAVEALVMNSGEPMDDFCEAMAGLREGVEVFGGLAHFGHAADAPKFVIDGDGNVLRWGASFVLYGGDDLHVMTQHIRGWKPLGTELFATRCTGNIVHELNGRSAQKLYEHYLHIENDESFFFNVLEFPFLLDIDGVSVLRTPIACLEDGSMILAAPVPEGSPLHIAYGDPEEILKAVREAGDELAAFRPDAIMLFPCGVRRTFWSDAGVNRELGPFQTVASTSGHFVAGELLRRGARVIEFNSTLVVVGMREGSLESKPEAHMEMPADRRQKKSLVARFANFIDAAMTELADSNRELEAANEALAKLSITDGLTGLLNRREIERRFREVCERAHREQGPMPFVIMMDLDDFKQVNDVYGHHEGDEALESFAKLLTELVDAVEVEVEFGRWGGEEFILFAKSDDPVAVEAFAESVRAGFEQASTGKHYRHTASFGVTRMRPGETPDAAIIRADEAMYQAKQTGKNKVVVLP